MNGKRFSWQGVAKLPFIDEKKLLTETRKLENTLTAEERARNSVFCDLLYISPRNSLAPQVCAYYNYFYQTHPSQRCLWPVDVYASGGMNGYLWLSERNGWRAVLQSPISGLEDIVYNHVLNITFINPSPHKHIPEPPRGVAMPKKILTPADIKPLPILWHEDNSGRRSQGSYNNRPQVPGAIHGNVLGEAAHRLLNNSLNIRSSGNSPGFYDQSQYRNGPNNNLQHRPRPAGPSDYQRNYNEGPNYYHNYPNPRGPIPRPKFGFSPPNHFQANRQNSKQQESDQYQDLNNGMAGLTMESGPSNRPYPVRMVQPQTAHNQNFGILPTPPPTWINRYRPPMMVDRNQQAKKVQPQTAHNQNFGNLPTSPPTGIYRPPMMVDRNQQAKKVYQIKTRDSQYSDSGI